MKDFREKLSASPESLEGIDCLRQGAFPSLPSPVFSPVLCVCNVQILQLVVLDV